MFAACAGGMAFSNSSVCLVHGMSRPIGAIFHLAHGLSNALLLPEITSWSLRGAIARYAAVSRMVGAAASEADESAAMALPKFLAELNAKLGIGRLRDFIKISEAEFEKKLPTMAEAALASGSPQNNPVVPTAAEIIGCIERCGEQRACWVPDVERAPIGDVAAFGFQHFIEHETGGADRLCGA